MTVLSLLWWAASLALLYYFFFYKRHQYKNASWSGAYFFENGCLVLNTGVPYPVPLEDVERVELHYSQREIDTRWSYSLWVWVVRKSGKTKKVYYKGSRNGKLPAEMRAELAEKGLRAVLVDE